MTVYYLLHVPKTGGITLAEHLQAHCAPGVLWRPLLKSPAPPPAEPEKVRAVALGHYQGRAVERYFPGREARRILLLRDPLSLQLSFFNWRMQFFRARGAGTYSFDLHLRTVPRNFMLHFLLRRWMGLSPLRLLAMPDDRKLDLAQKALAEFWFVGDSSDCDRVVAALAPELAVPEIAARRNSLVQLREFTCWTPLTADDLTPQQRAKLFRQHALDLLLWETWRGAGFAARDVAAVRAPKSLRGGIGHDLARPLFELARLVRRAGSPPRARLSLLQAAPADPEAWRAYLDGCRGRSAPPLPPEIVGTPETTSDAVLCALKAEALLCSGQGAQAARFSRRAPRLARTRLQALELVQRLSTQDTQFRHLVAEADAARDKRAWQSAMVLYGQALALYPGHAGYRLQYAHCLRESGDNLAAEIHYRSARAFGAPWSDVAPPLLLLAAKQNEPVPQAPPAPCPDAQSLLDDPPAAEDVRRLWTIAGRDGDDSALLAILRGAGSIRALIAQLVAPERVGETGRRFLAEAAD
jgi:hypothetical protein